MSTWFEYPWLLPLVVVLPLLAYFAVRQGVRRRAARLQRLGELPMIARLVPASALETGRWRAARLATAAALIGVAVAGPHWGYERSMVRASGVDMVLALDASLSMLAQDEKPSRLERMKQEVRRLRAMSPGDRVGMLAFAGRSYVLSPMTVDAGALDLFLDNLDPSVVGQAGSSLARTIKQGTDLLLLSSGEADKALVVMTDGEAFEPTEDIVAEAQRAGEKGVSLVLVGFGTPQGATIPTEENGRTVQKRDETGQVVVTRYSPAALQAAAQAAHGTFIPAEANDKAARIKQALGRLRTVQRAAAAGESRQPRFQLFLLPAVLLLLLDTLLGERRGRARRGATAAAHTSVETAALIAFCAFSLTSCARSTEASRAASAYRQKHYPEAVAGYRRAIAAGDTTMATGYDLGTSLLAADSAAPAGELLERTAGAKDPEIRHRSLFNFGLMHLLRGLASKEKEADADLDAALAAYKQVLLRRPGDQDAKWNYELALRKKQEGGGGGGGGGGSNAEQSPQPEQKQQQQSNGLAQQQAEQLLGSAARDEKDVQAKRQKQNRVEPPPGGKDW